MDIGFQSQFNLQAMASENDIESGNVELNDNTMLESISDMEQKMQRLSSDLLDLQGWRCQFTSVCKLYYSQKVFQIRWLHL